MAASSTARRRKQRSDPSAEVKLAVALAAGVLGGLIAGLLGAGTAAPLIAWDVLVVTFCSWVWAAVWGCDPAATARHALRDDPTRHTADLVIIAAAVASLIAVGTVVFGADHAHGLVKYLEAGLAVVSVFMSWVLIHTVFTLKYARLYYQAPVGGIDFNEKDDPQYSDFAYLSFTIGMTFQVSDTNISAKDIRRTALHQAWISFPLGAVIIAATINLVSGLAT